MSDARVYASTAGIARHFSSLGQQLREMTSAGLKSIELGYAPPLDGLSLPDALERFSARFLVHNYFPAPAESFVLNLASQQARTLERSRTFCREAIRLCGSLRAPFYSVHCGFLAEFEPGSLGQALAYDAVGDYEQGYATFLESLSMLLSEARDCGIRLLIEPNVVASFNLIQGENRLLMLAEPREFARLLHDLSDERLGVLVDLGHLNVTAATLGFTASTFLDTVASRVGGFHLHCNDGRTDQHLPVGPGSWMIDVLRQKRFEPCPVVVEAKFSTVAAMVQHCVWLEKTLS